MGTPTSAIEPGQVREIARMVAMVTSSEVVSASLAPINLKLDKIIDQQHATDTAVRQIGERVRIFLGSNGDDGQLQKMLGEQQRQIEEIKRVQVKCREDHDAKAGVVEAKDAKREGMFKGGWATLKEILVLLGFVLMGVMQYYFHVSKH